MIQRQSTGDAPAAIVSREGEAIEAEMTHHFDLVLRHRALGIAGVTVAVGRLAAVAVAAQIRRYDSELFGELRRDVPPLDMRLRPALQQQQRRSAAADDPV